MKFFTAVQLPEYPFSIGYKDKVFLIGSCFTENISRHLEYRKFQICENPFGIVYNPLSIYRTIERVGRKEKYSENDLFHFDGLYHSFDHHGSFSGKDASMVLDLINNNINSGSLFIRESNLLILTFGTSYVYEKKSDGHVVANCHKVPDDQFSRRLMDVDEIVNEWKGVYDLLKEVNPDLRVLITVSPVRHFRDGMTANQRSKATLILAAHQICEQSPNVFYFPSYEIMMDELRDYRFYDEDMVHPSRAAIRLIWERFSTSFFSEETRSVIKRVESVCKAKEHRAFRPETKEYKAFAENQIAKIDSLRKEYPFLDLQEEENYFRKSI